MANLSNIFLSTSPARGTTQKAVDAVDGLNISIHVPREGDDRLSTKTIVRSRSISIHVPREGDDAG